LPPTNNNHSNQQLTCLNTRLVRIQPTNVNDVLYNNGIVPSLNGLQEDTVLIDVTNYDLRTQEKLRAFFGSFNTKEKYVYYGRLKLERKHLGRVYIETGWDKSGEAYKNLITKGLDMDGTLIKDFRSLPMDANVKRDNIDRLPLHDPFDLIDQLERRFRSFGQILDSGLIKDGQCHVGEA
jgi:hypothetical protein